MKTVTIVKFEYGIAAFEFPEDARNFACDLWREYYSEIIQQVTEEDGVPFEEALNESVILSEEQPDESLISIRELVVN
jgi:hypothetical protein